MPTAVAKGVQNPLHSCSMEPMLQRLAVTDRGLDSCTCSSSLANAVR